jgi:hypothetical protein
MKVETHLSIRTERRPPLPGIVPAVRLFDFDHIRAKVGHDVCRQRTGKGMGDFNDPDSFEGKMRVVHGCML